MEAGAGGGGADGIAWLPTDYGHDGDGRAWGGRSDPPNEEPGAGSPSCDDSESGRIYRKLIDSELVEGQENRVLIGASGSPSRVEDYYIIRAPTGTSDDIITSGLTAPKQVRVILEMGE